MKLILITGLPGSGKTTYAKELFIVYTNANNRVLLTSDPRTTTEIQDAIEITKDGKIDIWIIETPYLCTKQDQLAFESSAVMKLQTISSIEWIFFENNPDQCLINIKQRNDLRNVLATVINYSKNYNIIENATVIPVWSPHSSMELAI